MAAVEPTARIAAVIGLGALMWACASPSAAPDTAPEAAVPEPGSHRTTGDGAPPAEPLASSPAPGDDTQTMVVIDEQFNPIGTADELRVKAEVYARCLIAIDAPLRALWFSYLSIVDHRWGYARSKWSGFGIVKADRIEACLDALAGARDLAPPLDDVDPLGVAYREATAAAMPLVEEARAYFGDKSYLKDQYKRAKAMHAPLETAFTAWLEASNELRKAINPIIASVYDAYTTQLASETSRGVPYLVERAAFQCMVVIDVLALPGSDPDRASASIESLRTANKDLAKKIKGDADANTAFLPLVSALTKVVTAAINVRAALDIRGFSKFYTAKYYRILVVAYTSAMNTYADSAAAWRESAE